MRVYHFTSAKYGLDDVRRRRLKIATLEDINDPFELAVCCDDKLRRRALRSTRREWANLFGMLCFSGDWHNPVQWSHYAEKHRGVCLGFDVSDELLVPIQYSAEPPQLDWDAIEQGGGEGKAEMLRWSSTKYVHWQYEQERRVFLALEQANEAGLYFHEFGKALQLREILVGPESSVRRHEVQEALGELSGVQCFKTRLAFRRYEVTTQHDPSMWR